MELTRYKELKQRLRMVFAEAGEDVNLSLVKSLKGSTDAEKLKELTALNEEIAPLEAEYKAVENARKGGSGDGHPMPDPADQHQHGLKVAAGRTGWKSGHWGEPFVKQVFGGDSGPTGMKGLITSGTVTVPSLSAGIVPILDRPTRLVDVIPVETLTETDTYAYLREETRELKAAETPKSTLKPTSVLKTKKIEGTVATIATVSEPVARQDLEDAALLRQYAEGSLAQAVMLRLDSQILNGTGSSGNLLGLANTSGIQVQTYSSDILTTTRKALTKLEEIQIPGGVFVMTPSEWATIELLRTEQGSAILTDGPVSLSKRQLWSQPVIVTTAVTDGKIYLADFAGSTKRWERGGVRVDWSEAPTGSVAEKSAFLTNELIFRAEGRWGFGCTRPAGVVQIATS